MNESPMNVNVGDGFDERVLRLNKCLNFVVFEQAGFRVYLTVSLPSYYDEMDFSILIHFFRQFLLHLRVILADRS